MTEGVLLVKGTDVTKEALGSVSLMNAKQLVFGRFGKDGAILHVAATAPADLQRAILEFAGIAGVTDVSLLAVSSGS
jgi:hypothetical protein